MRKTTESIVVVVGVAVLLLALGAAPAAAHEERKVTRYNLEVGFGDEPAYSGLRNSVLLIIHDAGGKPVVDLGDGLKVDVSQGSDDTQKLSLTMQPNFEVGGEGTPGDYRAWFIPTVPGAYTFHFTGTIKGQRVDQRFTSGPTTFDEVQDPAQVQFPAKDPTTGQLATRLDRETQRLNQALAASQQQAKRADDAAGTARLLALVGLVVGALGLVAAFFGLRRRA